MSMHPNNNMNVEKKENRLKETTQISDNLQPRFKQHIVPIDYQDLQRDLLEYLTTHHDIYKRYDKEQLLDLLFNLESMVYLDGEFRADTIFSRMLKWSQGGFAHRFFQKHEENQVETSFSEDLEFILKQLHTVMELAHFEKLPPEIVEHALQSGSYEKIFVRLQNVDVLHFYVRGSYIAKQEKNLTRKWANSLKMKSLLAPDCIEIFEEVVVLASEDLAPMKEGTNEETQEEEEVPEIDQNKLNEEAEEYLPSERSHRMKKTWFKGKGIREAVEQKLRYLQDKPLEEIIQERTRKKNRQKRMHVLSYHSIPESDLELLLPYAQISLGVKEYVQLCAAGTASVPALGKALITKSFKRLFTLFNPLFFMGYRLLYKLNIVKTEQKLHHAQYMLRHRLGRGAKAVSHIIDDYENVLKREIILLFGLLALEPPKGQKGWSQNELEEKARKYCHDRLNTLFVPDFSRTLPLMERWGIVQTRADGKKLTYQLFSLDELLEHTAITRNNLNGKIGIIKQDLKYWNSQSG